MKKPKYVKPAPEDSREEIKYSNELTMEDYILMIPKEMNSVRDLTKIRHVITLWRNETRHWYSERIFSKMKTVPDRMGDGVQSYGTPGEVVDEFYDGFHILVFDSELQGMMYIVESYKGLVAEEINKKLGTIEINGNYY